MSVVVGGGGEVQVSVSGGLGSPVVVSSSPAVPVGVSAGSAGQSQVGVNVGAANAVQVGTSAGVGPPIVVTGSGTTLVGVAGINPFVAGPNITLTTAGGSITIAGPEPRVHSVNFKTGTVLLSVVDLTAAAAVHTHTTAQIALFSAAAAGFSPVQSVAGKTGDVTIETSDIEGLDEALQASGKVSSVQGKTGAVTLTVSDLSAAAAVHAHSATSITGIDSVLKVHSVQGKAGTVTLSYADLSAAAAVHWHNVSQISGLNSLPSQEVADTGKVLRAGSYGAEWATPYSVVTAVLSAGSGVALSGNPNAGTLTIIAENQDAGLTSHTYAGESLSIPYNAKKHHVVTGIGSGVTATITVATAYTSGKEVFVRNSSVSGSTLRVRAEVYASSPITLADLPANGWAILVLQDYYSGWKLMAKGVDA